MKCHEAEGKKGMMEEDKDKAQAELFMFALWMKRRTLGELERMGK